MFHLVKPVPNPVSLWMKVTGVDKALQEHWWVWAQVWHQLLDLEEVSEGGIVPSVCLQLVIHCIAVDRSRFLRDIVDFQLWSREKKGIRDFGAHSLRISSLWIYQVALKSLNTTWGSSWLLWQSCWDVKQSLRYLRQYRSPRRPSVGGVQRCWGCCQEKYNPWLIWPDFLTRALSRWHRWPSSK